MQKPQLVHRNRELIALHKHRHVVLGVVPLLFGRYLALRCLTVVVKSVHGLNFFDVELLLVC